MPNPEEKQNLATQRSRVILCATCYPDAEAAMSLATELARQTGSELHGVFVRDRATLSAAGGMVSAVVSYSGVRATGVTMEDMLKAFQADARRFRDQLLRRARDATLWAAFEETEGRLTDAVQSTARSGDVIVFGFKPLLQGGHEIVVVLEEGGSVPEFAEALARNLNKRLVVLRLSGKGREDWLAKLNRMSPAAVILAVAQPGLPSLARIVEVARCPVIVPRVTKDRET